MYENDQTIAMAKAPLQNGVVTFGFHAPTVPGKLYGIRLPGLPGVSVALHRRYIPGLRKKLDGCYLTNDNWCFETVPALRIHPAKYAVNGLSRPISDVPNMWISEPGLPQWLELQFDETTSVGKVELIFDTNLDKPCYCGVPSECVRDYEVQAFIENEWRVLVQVSGNHHRRRIHTFDPVNTDKLRLVITGTNGDPCARVYEFRVFS